MAGFPQKGEQRVSSAPTEYNLSQLLLDAFRRWLKPAEICEILFNHHRLMLADAAPVKPKSGSLFLFDRNKLRYFRKDGHNWRKKKDGRTVREAHEKLKAGNKEAIHCYYAHGEDNPNFQRRSYWLLESGYENIVLVHYREVTEGYRLEESATMNDEKFGQVYSQIQATQPMYGDTDYGRSGFISSPSDVISPSQNSLEAPFDVDSGDELRGSQGLTKRVHEAIQASLLENELGLDSTPRTDYAPCSVSTGAKSITHPMLTNTAVNDVSQYRHDPQIQVAASQGMYGQVELTKDSQEGLPGVPWSNFLDNAYTVTDNPVDWTGLPESKQSEVPKSVNYTADTYNNQLVSKDLGSYLGHSMASNDTWQFGIDNQPDPKYRIAINQKARRKSGEHHIDHISVPKNPLKENQDVQTANNGLLSPTVSLMMQSIHSDNAASGGSSLRSAPKLLLNIVDLTPDWSYASEKTKVLVVGVFLDSTRVFSSTNWSCKFGEVEVPADILQAGVLRCIAPPHIPGKVSFCITCSDGVSCSNNMDFEFREKFPIESSSITKTSAMSEQRKEKEEAMLHQTRLASFLLSECTSSTQESLNDLASTQRNEKRELLVIDEIYWTQMESLIRKGQFPYEEAKAMLEQAFFKSALLQWLQSKSKGERTLTKFDRHGLGVLHRAAALGYEWAIAPLLEAGVGVNYRDAWGWTALHWAAFCGREKVIALLLAAAASPGALTDPTPSDPTGRTASDLAASSGHDGIAGYLGEAIVTSHFTSLNLSEMRKLSMAMAQNPGIEVMAERSKVVDETLGLTDDDLSLRDSLAAIRNAAQAEACISAAFRAYSFHRKREKESGILNEFGMLEEEARVFAAAQSSSRGCYEKSNLAATQIQRKYRGWKARNEYLCLKKNVVRIQAHVRGHQARKRYKKFLWTVSILDKVILRWRRKGSGLRGYKAEGIQDDDSDDDTYLKDFRKQKEAAFGEAVRRVKQMIQNPEARSQYRRMLEIYEKEKGAQLDEDLDFFDDCELLDLLGCSHEEAPIHFDTVQEASSLMG